MPATFAMAPEPGKKVFVVSHERSGTHFLMNTLAHNFNYVARPWWNLDLELGLNFHAPQVLLEYFKKAHDLPIRNILKSHHSAAFFEDIIDYLIEQFHIIYIYRDPRNVMESFCKHINTLQWDEGPKSATVSEFIRCTPRGGILRYQKDQETNILTRWSTHVDGWLNLAGKKSGSIKIIRYEDLDTEFEKTVRDIGDFICKTATMIKRPDRNVNVIGASMSKPPSCHAMLTQADEEFILEQIGVTLGRLGY